MTAEELQRVVELIWESDVEREIRLERADAAERRWTTRLWAAVLLSPTLSICEALVSAVPVPARRLEPAWVRALGLTGDVVLDEALVLRMNACGPVIGRKAA